MSFLITALTNINGKVFLIGKAKASNQNKTFATTISFY